ncbi:MAG: YfcC family protein [Clostridia bacterium]
MKKFSVPSSLSIVMIFLLIVTLLTWIVPTSVVTYDDDGTKVIHYNSTIDDDGNVVEGAGTSPKGLWNLILSPVEGFINASDVAGTIFVSGGLLAVLGYVGALDAGINSLLKKYQGSKLIVLLMLVFALMGTVYGSWEELPAYAIVIIPLFIKAGYDAVTGVTVILLGAGIGNMASIVNPYSVGAAVAAIGNDELSLGSGIFLRMILFVAMLAVGSTLVIKYANTVKNDPSKSCVADIPRTKKVADSSELVEMTSKRKWSLIVFAITVLFCVLGYIPWDAIPTANGGTAFDFVNGFITTFSGNFIGNFLGTDYFTPFGWWYFNEFSVIWAMGAIVIAVINKIPEKKFVAVFTQGAADLMSVVLVLAVARGISLTMGSSSEGMSITFIYWIKAILEGVPIWAFALAGILVYMLIGIFLQSTSGVSGITMPIFGAVAMALFAYSSVGAVGGQIILISSFTVGINFVSSLYPGATQMGILEMAEIPYDRYVKQVLKIMLPVLCTGALIITIAPYIGLV